MKTNLLLIDSFQNMEYLVAYAFSFSHRTNRQLKIIYVYDFERMQQAHHVASAAEPDPILVNVHAQAKKEFEGAELKITEVISNYLKNHSVDVPVEFVISEEKRLDILDSEIRKYPDVVLLTSDTQSYVITAGGLAGYPNLVDSLRCPVLIIPENTKYASLKHVLYASDFHRDDIFYIRKLKALLHQPDLQITILHNDTNISHDEDARWQNLLKHVRAEEGFQSITPVLKKKSILLDAVQECINENHPDLLVLLKENKGFLKEIFIPANTKNMTAHINIPVLVVHEK